MSKHSSKYFDREHTRIHTHTHTLTHLLVSILVHNELLTPNGEHWINNSLLTFGLKAAEKVGTHRERVEVVGR